jgi:hypothetical protein
MALTCRVVLSKSDGLTLIVEDEQGKTKQTVVLDGKSIVLTCSDAQDSSTITQKSDSIAVKCKAFSVDAETVNVKSSKDSTYESEQKLTLSSKQDYSVSSQANVSVSAQQDVKLSGANLSGEGKQQASLSAATVSVKADGQAELAGKSTRIGGTLSLELKGATVKVAADGMLEADGQATTVKGQMLNLQGTMVKLG